MITIHDINKAKQVWNQITKAITKGTPAWKINDWLSEVSGLASSLFKGSEPPKNHELWAMSYIAENPGPSLEARRSRSYDRFPLVVKLFDNPDGFDGASLHYLSRSLRDEIIDLLKMGPLTPADRERIADLAISLRAYASYKFSRIQNKVEVDPDLWPAISSLPNLPQVDWQRAHMTLARINLRRGLRKPRPPHSSPPSPPRSSN